MIWIPTIITIIGALLGFGTAWALISVRKDWRKSRAEVSASWSDYAKTHPNRDNKAGDPLR